MSVVIITEYEEIGKTANHDSVVPAPLEPSTTSQEVTIGAQSTASNYFHRTTTLVVVQAQANCRIKFGAEPTAETTNCIRIPQDGTFSFAILKNSGLKLAVIAE